MIKGFSYEDIKSKIPKYQRPLVQKPIQLLADKIDKAMTELRLKLKCDQKFFDWFIYEGWDNATPYMIPKYYQAVVKDLYSQIKTKYGSLKSPKPTFDAAKSDEEVKTTESESDSEVDESPDDDLDPQDQQNIIEQITEVQDQQNIIEQINEVQDSAVIDKECENCTKLQRKNGAQRTQISRLNNAYAVLHNKMDLYRNENKDLQEKLKDDNAVQKSKTQKHMKESFDGLTTQRKVGFFKDVVRQNPQFASTVIIEDKNVMKLINEAQQEKKEEQMADDELYSTKNFRKLTIVKNARISQARNQQLRNSEQEPCYRMDSKGNMKLIHGKKPNVSKLLTNNQITKLHDGYFEFHKTFKTCNNLFGNKVSEQEKEIKLFFDERTDVTVPPKA
eukprot:470390_1